MADKDEFKFDDDDGFSEADLSGAFADGEQAVSDEPDYPMTIKKSGGSKTRLLLLLLLLAVAAAGGYYFFLMSDPPPPPPKKAVAVPKSPPAPAPLAPSTGSPAQISVPAPPPPQATPAVQPVPPAPTAVSVSPPKPAPPAAAAPAVAPTAPAPAAAVEGVPSAREAAAALGGPWLVEAGTYLNPAALKAVEKSIRSLGYEPQVTTKQRNVRMIRLRIGSYLEDELKEALAYARGIAPDAFALRDGDAYTVYAGTFTSPQNIRQMTERLTSEGVAVEVEPLEVKRTISLVRFGAFADQAAAAEAAAKARKAGIAAKVIGPR